MNMILRSQAFFARNRPSLMRRVHESVKLASKPAKLSEPSQLVDNSDVFIFDCDGVIWRGDSIIPGVPDVLEHLRKLNKKIFFGNSNFQTRSIICSSYFILFGVTVTNNSTKSRKGYKKKFTSLGLNVNDEEIFSSSFAAAAYLEQTNFLATGKKVYIIGDVGIGEELDLLNIPHFGGPADSNKVIKLGPGL